jgi:alkylation response protein AidB-like acyl-CoA dehydrogenase
MPQLILSRRDLEFVLYEWLDIGALAARPAFAGHSRETLDAALDIYERMAVDRFAPHNKVSDRNEPTILDGRVRVIPEVGSALTHFASAGLLAAAHDAEFGGMNLPYVVERAGMAVMLAANCSTSSYAFLTQANANLLLSYGTQDQIERYVRPMLAGRYLGAMCLSEPQAGSSLGDITTRAEVQPDGRYRLFGTKMWISGGEHEISENIVHLVLAKVPLADGRLPAGSKGISLFLVPRLLLDYGESHGDRNDISVVGLNHKMGQRGVVNCALNFGDGRFLPGGKAGALGELIGEAGSGLACMFHMMNEARITVGLGAVALGYTGYLHAVEYARNRVQGRTPDQRDPAAAPTPIIEHADVKRMLLAQKAYVEGGLGLGLFCAKLVDEKRTAPHSTEREDASALLDLLTPVAKSWPSQWCLAANDLAIQVHGGYGYTRDFDVEQFYRDNRLNAIHEGTHGIQALDLLGRKVGLHDGASLRLLDAVIFGTIKAARQQASLSAYGADLERTWGRMLAVNRSLAEAQDVAQRLANASAYLEAFGHVVVAWIWLEQALVASSALAKPECAERDFYQGKLMACRYFFRWELPRADAWFGVLDPVDTTCLDMRVAAF